MTSCATYLLTCLLTVMWTGFLSVMLFALSVCCFNLVVIALCLCHQDDVIINRCTPVGIFFVSVVPLLDCWCFALCIFNNICLIFAGTHLCLSVHFLNMLIVLLCFWQVVQFQYYTGHTCKMYCAYRINYGT